MNAVKNFFLVFMLFCMVPIVILIQLETAVLTTILNEDFYTSSFKSINLYEKMAAALLEQIESELNAEIPEDTSAEFIENISSALDNLAETQFKDKIAGLRSYIFFENKSFNLDIDLRNFKDELSDSFSSLHLMEEQALISYFINSIPDKIDLVQNPSVTNESFQSEFNNFKFVFFIPFFFLPFFLIFYLILNGVDKGLIWFGSGLIASGLILAFIIILSFSSIDTQIDYGVRTIAENSGELYELFYNLAISFINSVRNTGFVFAGIGVIILVAIKIKRENEKPDTTTEGQISEF